MSQNGVVLAAIDENTGDPWVSPSNFWTRSFKLKIYQLYIARLMS